MNFLWTALAILMIVANGMVFSYDDAPESLIVFVTYYLLILYFLAISLNLYLIVKKCREHRHKDRGDSTRKDAAKNELHDLSPQNTDDTVTEEEPDEN